MALSAWSVISSIQLSNLTIDFNPDFLYDETRKIKGSSSHRLAGVECDRQSDCAEQSGSF